jgi:predicted RNase H-like HicB family nuclease
MKHYTAIIERCPDTNLFVGYVPGIPGAHTQAESLDELRVNLREVLELLTEEGKDILESEFVGTQQIVIP